MSENNKLSVLNPDSGAVIRELDIPSFNEVDTILKESSSYTKWRKLTLNQRCNLIVKFRKCIVKNKDKLEEVIKSETSKKDFDIFIECFSMFEHLKETPKIAKKFLKPSKRSSGLLKNKKAYVVYEPLGVAAIISPWNYPLMTPISATIEALLAGNNVVLKPSEYTPLTSLYIKKLWDEHIGYNEAFNVVNGRGDVGFHLVQSKLTDIICFTGSTKIGKLIAKECAESLKPVILELGGKDPMIILKDANIDRSVEAAVFAGMSNAGQTCISVEEVFVEEEIFEDVRSKISRKVKDMSAGNKDSMEIGPMIMDVNCSKVKEHIEENEKSSVIQGTSIEHDRYIAPTIIVNPSDDSRIVNEETFGPVISLRSFKNRGDLISKIHKTGYGLAGSIFGRDMTRIKNISSKLKIGNISINDVMSHYGIASLPFGGEGLSGIGRLHGKEGLRSLCRSKSVVINRLNFLDDPWWFSRTPKIEKFLKKIINILYS